MWQKFMSYLMFWKKDQNKTDNKNLKLMHGINRISILMFLVAIIVIIVKLALK